MTSMMSHWIWKNDLHSEAHASLGTSTSSFYDRGLRFDEGVFMTNPPTGAALDIALARAGVGFLEDNLVVMGLTGILVSARLRAVLEENGVDNIQYFAVNLTMSDGATPSQRYFIGNIVGRVACLDFERSDVTMDPGPPAAIDAIDHLVLHEDEIQDLDVFRLGELPLAIIVSSRLKDAIVRSRVSGVAFHAVDEFLF